MRIALSGLVAVSVFVSSVPAYAAVDLAAISSVVAACTPTASVRLSTVLTIDTSALPVGSNTAVLPQSTTLPQVIAPGQINNIVVSSGQSPVVVGGQTTDVIVSDLPRQLIDPTRPPMPAELSAALSARPIAKMNAEQQDNLIKILASSLGGSDAESLSDEDVNAVVDVIGKRLSADAVSQMNPMQLQMAVTALLALKESKFVSDAKRGEISRLVNAAVAEVTKRMSKKDSALPEAISIGPKSDVALALPSQYLKGVRRVVIEATRVAQNGGGGTSSGVSAACGAAIQQYVDALKAAGGADTASVEAGLGALVYALATTSIPSGGGTALGAAILLVASNSTNGNLKYNAQKLADDIKDDKLDTKPNSGGSLTRASLN